MPKGEPTQFMKESLLKTESLGKGGLVEFKEQGQLWAQVYRDLGWTQRGSRNAQ